MKILPLICILMVFIVSSLCYSATWQDYPSLNENLVLYYNFETTTGKLLDVSNNTANLTEVGIVPTGVGKIGNTRGVYAADKYFYNNTVCPSGLDYDKDFSISFWYNSSGANDNSQIFGFGDTNYENVIRHEGGTDKLYFYTQGSLVNIDFSTPALNTWHHVVVIYNGTGDKYAYGYLDNGTAIKSNAQGTDFVSNTVCYVGRGAAVADQIFTDGYLDELAIYKKLLTKTEIGQLYNDGNGITFNNTVITEIIINYQTITSPIYWNTPIINLSWNVSNAQNGTMTLYKNGEVNQTIFYEPIGINYTEITNIFTIGDNISYNLYLQNDTKILTQNSSIVQIQKYPINITATYTNFKTLYNLNYSRILNYSLTYVCDTLNTTKIYRMINNEINKTYNATCNFTIPQEIKDTFSYSIEGKYNISFLINTTEDENYKNQTSTKDFISDLYAPNIVLNYTSNSGFASPLINITMSCSDTIMSNLTYNLTFNNIQYQYRINLTNATTITNNTISTNGNNVLIGSCEDLFTRTTETQNFNIYSKQIFLIDEILNTAFNVNNISSVKVYIDDNSTLFDFKTQNTNVTNFTSMMTNKLRFEFIYLDGTTITRYVDTSIINESLRVCVNREGVTHYEQLIISATQRPVTLKNVYSNCLVASDYTRFAYQDAFLLKAFTISSLYYLYTNDNGNVLLGSLDGSISSYINVDTLEFKQQAYTIETTKDIIAIETNISRIATISYLNVDSDNTYLNLSITNTKDGTLLFNYDEFTNYNNFTLYWDYSSFGLDNDTILSASFNIIREDDSVANKKYYFTTQGGSGLILAPLAFAISFLLMIFGFTLASSRMTFGWFGIFVALAAVGLTTFAVKTWYILFLQAMEVIVLIYIVLLILKTNKVDMV
jgi:hypothetical protein